MKNLFENWRKHLSEQENSIVIPERYRGTLFYNIPKKMFMAAHPDGDHFVNSNDEPIKLSDSELKNSQIVPVFKEDIAFRKSLTELNKFEEWLSDYNIVYEFYELSYLNEEIYFPSTIENLLLGNDSLYYEIKISEINQNHVIIKFYNDNIFHPTKILFHKQRYKFEVICKKYSSHDHDDYFTTKFSLNDKEWEWEVAEDKDKEFTKILYLLCQYTGMFDT